MKTIPVKDRLNSKTLKAMLTNHFEGRYKFSPVVAESLASDGVYLRTILNPDSRQDGQITRYVVKNTEPAGKPLKNCEYVPAKLTVNAPDDAEHRQRNGLKELKLRVIKRITDEAVDSGGCLAHEDISDILFIDRSTVSAYIKELKGWGIEVKTRADFTDSGRGISHKAPILKLFLQGVPETKISERTCHELSCVETYIKDFLRIGISYRKGDSEYSIARMTGLTPNLIREYIKLYEGFDNDSYFKEALHKTLDFYDSGLLVSLKKSEMIKWTKKTVSV
ncbi:MAG: hypothetical protein A7316_03470 [Candidatus Altiarchaeales archaeon WOR_SM1_86-2]|nr:MAG: hypothetical protein A7316_03470 [Candidatus Altiarchaeales archaeon WOR_SM1_86-2]